MSVKFELMGVVALECGVLLVLPEKTVAHHQGFYVRAHETAEGVFRSTNDLFQN
jgi:hypothetical protein